MGYRNGKDILPPRLLLELQQYIEGEIVYIPKLTQDRAGWGQRNGTREAFEARNAEICRLYHEGYDLDGLVAHFFLSQDTIRRILSRSRQAQAVGSG